MEFLVITGPTGSGKSNFALSKANEFIRNGVPAEIISADSIAVYRGFDIGAAKPSAAEQALVPHHLIDICDPTEDFTAGDFVRAAETAISEICSRNAKPIVVGGTGFYLRALVQGMVDKESEADKLQLADIELKLRNRAEKFGMQELYQEMLEKDPDLKGVIHENDHYRILRALSAMNLHKQKWSQLNAIANARPPAHPEAKIFGIDLGREELSKRVRQRTEGMLASGLLAEVEELLAQGIPASAKPFLSVGYFECLQYLGKIPQANPQLPITDADSLREAIVRSTMKLAKGQMTYLRGQLPSVEWICPNA